MTLRRWRSRGAAALTGLLLGALLVAPVSGQGPYSAQIQALLNGTNTWSGANTFPTALAVGPLAQVNTDPIFGTTVPIASVVGARLTAGGLAYGQYIGASAEPSVDGLGIYIGSEVLLNEPDTNTHTASQFYGQETFVYHNSLKGATSAIGQNAVVQWLAGPLGASMTGYIAQVQNDGSGAISNAIRGLGVTLGNNGSGTAVNMEGVKINTPNGAGVTNVYGLRITDQTFSGASINRAIDVNGKFIVGPDGATLSVNGTIQGAFKSSDGTSGATVTTCTGFKNGLCISGT